MPYSSLRTCLPDRLRHLTLSPIYNDKSLKSSSLRKLNAERSRHLLKIGLEEDCLDDSEKRVFQSKNSSDRHTILDFLPKTLRTLIFSESAGWEALKDDEWSHLPKRLETVQFIGTEALSPGILLHMPVTHLRSLHLTLESVSEAHLKRLPRNMLRLMVTVDSYSLRPAAALAAPPDITPYWLDWRRDNGDSRDYFYMVDLETQRRAAVKAGDPAKLAALGLGPDYYAC